MLLLCMMAIITQNRDLNPKIKERNVVTADFTTHGQSHFYGLPCISADSLDHMDHFCTFDVSKITPKNMQKLPYMYFNPFLAYIHEKGIKSHIWQLLHVFRDYLGNIKGTKMVHVV